MPITTQNASWDYNPGDTVTLSATFTFDLQDPNDSQTVASVLTTLQGRTPTSHSRKPTTPQFPCL